MAELAADFIMRFYDVQVGALEIQEFRTQPAPSWLVWDAGAIGTRAPSTKRPSTPAGSLCLVDNAAIFGMAPLLESRRRASSLFQVNVEGVFFVLQAVARLMVRDGRRGRIINMASQAGRRGEAASAIYVATKPQ